MEQVLKAIALTLRNLGFDDATVENDAVILRGIHFQARTWYGRKSFTFCGRTYRTGNVKQAVLDLIQALPDAIAKRERAMELRRQEMRLEELNKKLSDSGLQVVCYGTQYELHYKASLDRCEEVARQIMNAEEIAFASIDSRLAALSTTFDSEGGFSLN